MNDNPVGYLFLGFIILGLIIFAVPKNQGPEKYERDVQSVALAYPVYVSDLCPNKSGLDDVKNSYLKTLDEKDVSQRDWVNSNFETVFMKKCLDSEKNQVDK